MITLGLVANDSLLDPDTARREKTILCTSRDSRQKTATAKMQETRKEWKHSIIVSALISWCEFSRDICLK